MTQDLLVDIGEEYFITNNVNGATLTVGLYNDSTDAVSETSNVDDITSEPSNGNYARQPVTVSASNIDGNWGVSNDSVVEFDFSDITSSEDIDTAFVTANFDSTEAGTNEAHLIANPSLSQTRDIGSIDKLEIATGDLELKLD